MLNYSPFALHQRVNYLNGTDTFGSSVCFIDETDPLEAYTTQTTREAELKPWKAILPLS